VRSTAVWRSATSVRCSAAMWCSAVFITTAVFGSRFVVSGAYVPLTVAGFVWLEMREGLRPAFRQRTMIAVVRIVAVIDVAVEAVRTVKPGAGTDKDSADEPVGAVVAVGGALVRCIVEVAVWTYRSNPDTDGDLGGRHRGCGYSTRDESQERKRFSIKHVFSLPNSSLEALRKGGSCSATHSSYCVTSRLLRVGQSK
jgi:hypothetical protein